MNNEDLKRKLQFIQKQFLCCVPIRTFQWLNIFNNLNWEEQNNLIALTVNSDLVINKPIKIGFQRAFLKFLVHQLEEKGTEVRDEIYEALGRVVALREPSESFKHYILENEQIITLRENPNIISEGTTGLCSWQASIALAEWSLSNVNVFQNRTVLELGSGIGLTGIVIAKYCKPTDIYLTDCHRSVLQVLCNNIKLNLDTVTATTPNRTISKYQIKTLLSERLPTSLTVVKVLSLPWEDVTESICDIINPNVLIAADVIYDSTLFSPLINAISCFLKGYCTRELIIACTERNKDTLEEFLSLLEIQTFRYTELELPPQKNFVWSTECPIRIFSIKDGPVAS